MKDANNLTVAALKDRLKRLNLSTAGSKAELILRLNEADPTGQWMEKDMTVDEEDKAAGVTHVQDVIANEEELQVRAPWLEREQKLARRERELMQREIEFMRRENEHLRAMMQSANNPATGTVTSKVSLTNLKEMLPSYDGKKGSFQRWKEQLLMVKQMYQLDEGMTKLLLGAKLTGEAEEWFHSVSTHLSLAVDELLRRMTVMYGRRENKLTLRKEFENRMWQHGETFAEYCHKKIILSNKVPIDEEEIIEYVIDGIPVKAIRQQAMMQQFTDKETMLKAMENISLGSDQKIVSRTDRISSVENIVKAGSAKKTEVDSNAKQEPRCFNCNELGHLAAKCLKPKRERGVCFRCLQMGYRAKDCTAKKQVKSGTSQSNMEKKDGVNIVNGDFDNRVGDYRRKVNYRISSDTGEVALNCKLDMLLDTSSPINFVKGSFIPPNLIMSVSLLDDRYFGLNDSKLEVKGSIDVEMSINNKEPKHITLLVVSARSIKSSVVIGRNILKQFFEQEGSSDVETENAVIREILNISVDNQKTGDNLNINPYVDTETQAKVRELFVERYINPQRPEQPQVDAEIKLKLKEDKPFYFSVTRPSYAERKELRALLDSLLEQEIIRPSESEYASPIVLVRKKTGDLRLCVDYRELNKLLIRDHYPLPNVEDLIDSLHGKKYFTRIDLRNGFYHIKLSEESVKYTAFTTPFGQFEFLRMPFGLKVAPSRFQRYINQILSELIRQFKIVLYMDDILIVSTITEQHIQILKSIFKLFVANKLELRIDKCAFL